jgi:hypothetical protein
VKYLLPFDLTRYDVAAVGSSSIVSYESAEHAVMLGGGFLNLKVLAEVISMEAWIAAAGIMERKGKRNISPDPAVEVRQGDAVSRSGGTLLPFYGSSRCSR